MAETLAFTIVEGILGKLGSFLVQEIGLTWGAKKDLKKLQTTLTTISAVILDAEDQQVKNRAVRDWLEKLKDVLYDADDVLDEFSTEALRRKVKIHGSMLKEVLYFFSPSNPLVFHFKMGHEIKDIRERLDNIAADRRNFQFVEQDAGTQIANREREQTHSFVRGADVIGRESDKKKIVELLLSSSYDHESLTVLPIVGLGGLGKTTLAKLVYSDDRVVGYFELRMWVCVSEDFDLKKVVEKIIKSAMGGDCGNLELDQLQRCIRDILCAKKFLLILDDVWNDDRTKWTELKNLLMDGASGSKIIVTTRSRKIASIMGTVSFYNLKGISDDECLSILVKCAFNEGHEKGHPKLVEIGKAIASKCGGIPLAARTLGSLLYMKTEESEWSCIKNNDIWKLEQKENDILPALKLSYEQLPYYLKQCFSYCSIFPKDCEIWRDVLICHWIAQGFLQSPERSCQLEDIGNRYFNELISRSFFQDIDVKFDGVVDSFKIHDLIHDLAQLVAHTEWSNVNFNSEIITERVRHVTFTEYNLSDKEFPTSLLSAKKLRSFRFNYIVGPISESFVSNLTSRFRSLRVLDLCHSDFEELPSFVGNLKHLRILTLSGNHKLKVLPNSVCKLVNLQTLMLEECEKLEDLPRDIEKLINLRHLSLTSKLTCMPKKGLRGLTSLQFLWLYKCNHLTSLSEGIQHLTSLRKLDIEGCPSLASLPCGMKNLTALVELVIRDCEELDLMEGEGIDGLRSLRSLSIGGLPKLVALPRGLQQCAATLQYLGILNCAALTTLPDWLKHLTSLLRLYIRDCPNLMSLTEGMRSLTALQQLSIRECPQLSERCKRATGEDWPNISHVLEIYLDSMRIKCQGKDA